MLEKIAVLAAACACNSSRPPEPKPAAVSPAHPATMLAIQDLWLYASTTKHAHLDASGRIEVFSPLPRDDQANDVVLGTMQPDGTLVYRDGTKLVTPRSPDDLVVSNFGQILELKLHEDYVELLGPSGLHHKLTVDERDNIRVDGQLDSTEPIVKGANDAAAKRTAVLLMLLANTAAESAFWLERPNQGE